MVPGPKTPRERLVRRVGGVAQHDFGWFLSPAEFFGPEVESKEARAVNFFLLFGKRRSK